MIPVWSASVLNTHMQKTTIIPADFLVNLKLLPDGKATADQGVWMQSWGVFLQQQVAKGKIKVYDIPEFDPETGQVPNTVIERIYLQNRKLH